MNTTIVPNIALVVKPSSLFIAPLGEKVVYQPNSEEVIILTDEAKANHPHLAKALDQAAQLVIGGEVSLDLYRYEKGRVAEWIIGGQRLISSKDCHCQSIRDGSAPVIEGAGAFCIHRLALAIYLRILRARMNESVHSLMIEVSLLTHSQFSAYGHRLGCCTLERIQDDNLYHFQNYIDAAAYALWRGRLQELEMSFI
jgi:hypothetical protein